MPKIEDNSLFEFDKKARSKRLIICNNSMVLWVSLQMLKYRLNPNKDITERRNYYKMLIRSYPYDTNDCKCKECRYHRFVKHLRKG